MGVKSNMTEVQINESAQYFIVRCLFGRDLPAQRPSTLTKEFYELFKF